jgi:DNA (cytosine-5)-methyltransferase 1
VTPTVDQTFAWNGRKIVREVRAGKFAAASVLTAARRPAVSAGDHFLGRTWERLVLRGRTPRTELSECCRPIRVVDLCCGPGGFATGFRRACQAVGVRCTVAAAVDISRHALAVYRLNLRPRRLVAEHVANLIDYDDGTSIPVVAGELHTLTDAVDVVLAGPPCEGNSNLNNWTRRVDRRNELYVSCVALAIGMRAQVLIVENVAQVTKAKQHVVPRAARMLERYGYQVVSADLVLDAAEFGAAQRRRRHFLVAARTPRRLDAESITATKIGPLSVMEAIGDLTDAESDEILDRPSRLSPENQARVDYLFAHPDSYDLPESERPECHRDGHTYPSVYGRMRADQPCQTITTGFLSPGRGRYVHPTVPRSLTLREGARLQGFADDYRWFREHHALPRTTLAHLIGNAVPPQLGYVTGLLGLAALA